MFGWFQKRQNQSSESPRQPVDRALQAGVVAMVTFLHSDPTADDEVIVRHLTDNGLSEQQATKLIQFVPIAFTRFLYRNKGVRFAPNYVLLGADGQPVAQRPIVDEPAFREAWGYCEQAALGAVNEEYFTLVAARSGGYRAIQDLVRQGSDLAGVATGPPVMTE